MLFFYLVLSVFNLYVAAMKPHDKPWMDILLIAFGLYFAICAYGEWRGQA